MLESESIMSKPVSQTTDQAKQWAQVIRNKSSDGGVISVIEAINKQTDMHRAIMAVMLSSRALRSSLRVCCRRR